MDKELEKIKRKKLKELLKQGGTEKSKISGTSQKQVFGGNKMETEIEVNDNNFEKEVIERSKNIPVVVDFWAEWCPPCKMLGPVLEKLSREYNGRFILAKVDLNENKEKADEYGVRSIPNVKMFKNGDIVDEFIGAVPEEQVKEWLNKNIG